MISLKHRLAIASLTGLSVLGGAVLFQTATGIPAAISAQAADAETYIFPDSDSQYISSDDLDGMSKKELQIARNEIYARHGRYFNDDGLQEYFWRRSWYEGEIEPDDFDESVFNKHEKANIKTIKKAESKSGSTDSYNFAIDEAKSAYESVNEQIDNGELEKNESDGIASWSDEDGEVYKLKVYADNDLHLHFSYDIEYYYNSYGNLVFVFATDGENEKRWYYDETEVLYRYIDEKGKTHNYKNGNLPTGKVEEYFSTGEEMQYFHIDGDGVDDVDESDEGDMQSLTWYGADMNYTDLDVCDMDEDGMTVKGYMKYGSMDDIWSDDIEKEYIELSYPFAEDTIFSAGSEEEEYNTYEDIKKFVDDMGDEGGLFMMIKVEEGEIKSVIISS